MNWLQALIYRLLHDTDEPPLHPLGRTCPVDLAFQGTGETFGWQRQVWFVDGGHPKDCCKPCCIDIRVLEYPWDQLEQEIKR